MLIERPRPARTKVGQPGKIIVKGWSAAQVCTVDNLDTLGACIRFDSLSAEHVPDKFDLTFDNGHSLWSFQTTWHPAWQ